MRRALLFSFLLHFAVGLFATLEYSWHKPKPLINHGGIEASLASLPQKPEPPKQQPAPKPAPVPPPKPEPVDTPKPETVKAAKPAPKPVQKLAPKPTPTPPPKPKTVEAPKAAPKPIPAPLPKPKPNPKPIAEPDPIPKKPTQVVKAPSSRPQQKSRLQSLLKDISEESPPENTQVAKVDPKIKPEKAPSELSKLLEDIVAEQPREPQPLQQQGLTNDDFQRLRAQLAGCWNIPAGAKAAENLRIEVRVLSAPDGEVTHASLLDPTTNSGNSYYTIAAESALRALRHPNCQKLALPLDKYEQWQDMTFVFDPKDLF